MRLKEFIQKHVLRPKLQQASVLVVYDPARRYHALCLELADARRCVIDASESSIESREAALAALQELAKPGSTLDELLVYVPAQRPLTDEEKQRDPFALYEACGAVFPDGDGEEYQSLCLRAKADRATEIRRIFSNDPNPPFAVIDAVDGGAGWPTLQALLQAESAQDILFALLVPSEQQKAALKGQEAWVAEAKALVESALGLRLMTRAKSWSPIADELWRYLLFSEFVFDLPGELPSVLADVPRAPLEARLLVEDLCDRLRNDRRTQGQYIERAETIEQELYLPEVCRQIEDLGVRDTFPFEERSFFAQAVDALRRDNVDKLRKAFARHADSVWVGRGENQAQWTLLQSAASLVESCDDADRQIPEHARTFDALLDYYVTSLREVDRLQREFEQLAGDYIDTDGQMAAVMTQARGAYRKIADKVQGVFIKHLERSGWPPAGRLANADVFDKLVATKLQESGRRVALLLIDALRYELGVELQKQLAEDDQAEIQAAFAQLPSVTPVGMATLLPGAGHALRLKNHDGQVIPYLGEQPLTNVNQRLDVLRRRYGQRFAEMALKDFVRGKADLPGTVELLLLRSNEMDNDFEGNPEAAPGLIRRTFQQIRGAIQKLRGLDFQDVLIVTDHGFYLNTAIEAGDVCAKPPGKWITIHDRLLLGDGRDDAGNVVLPAEHVGIRGDFNQVAIPRAMVAYRAGQSYFHGGASLQETVVPVIAVRLSTSPRDLAKQPTLTLRYKRGKNRITTRLPVVELEAGAGDLFSMDTPLDVLVEAQDKLGNVVGEAMPGGAVNPATRMVSIKPGETVQVTLKMDLEFQGKFTVKALDPMTLTAYSKLDLETDYTV